MKIDRYGRARYRIAITFVVLFLTGLVLAWPTLSWPMVYDDLHLIRHFSIEQIETSFHGPWDPDMIETPGFRPFTLIFNQIRYHLFGENVVAQRLFLIGLYAVYLTAMCWIVWQFCADWLLPVVAGVLWFCAKYSVFHYVWLADGVHALQGITFVVAIIALFHALRHPVWWKFIFSIIVMSVGLLTREDTLVVIPALLLLGYVYASQHKQLRMPYIHCYAVTILLICLALLVYRSIVVPEVDPPDTKFSGMFLQIVTTFNLLGLSSFDLVSRVLVFGWTLILLGIGISFLVQPTRLLQHNTLLWLLCGVLGCASGLNTVRPNLLFFSTTFISLFVCSALWGVWNASRIRRCIIIGAVLWGIVGGAYISNATALNFHPYSSTALQWNSQFIYTFFATSATIPVVRRVQITQQLRSVGINSSEDVQTRFPLLIAHALASHQQRPGGDGVFFVPRMQGIFAEP